MPQLLIPEVQSENAITQDTLNSHMETETTDLRRETNHYRPRELRNSLQQSSIVLPDPATKDVISVSSQY